MHLPAARRWGMADSLIAAGALTLLVLVFWHTQQQLNYDWDWQTSLRYFISRNDSGGWSGGFLLDGLLMSIRLMLFGGVLALLIGTGIGLLALSPLPALRGLARLYIEGLRHLPPIVFMFVFFYFISSQLFSADLWRGLLQYSDNGVGRFIFGEPARAENLIGGVLCLAVFEAAFVAEIIRAGVLAVDDGQRQAARSLGLSASRAFLLIILPQALARVAAPLTGQLVLLVKDSAILSVISVQELTFSAQETAVSTQQIFETWLLAAFLYFMMCAPLLWLCKKLERAH